MHHLTSAHFFIQSPRMTASVLRGPALFASRSRKAPMHGAQFPSGFHRPVTPQTDTIRPDLMDISAHIPGMILGSALWAPYPRCVRIRLSATRALPRLHSLFAPHPHTQIVFVPVCFTIFEIAYVGLFDAVFTAYIVSKRWMLATRRTDAIPPALIPPRLGSFRIVTAHRSSSS